VHWRNCDRSEMAAHYRAADALVFPSTGHEAFGLVPLEAMACGTPVVATGAGGSAEYLADGENSLLFAPSDPQAVANALSRLGAARDLRRRIVAGGLETAARLTVDRQADKLEAVHLAAARR
jgi:D-inositol-3-phosphate glycosyltransferase